MPPSAARVNLIETTLARRFPGVLAGRGAGDGRDVSGRFAGAGGGHLQEQPEFADYFNDAHLPPMVESFVEERLKQDAAARIRILEVGAGNRRHQRGRCWGPAAGLTRLTSRSIAIRICRRPSCCTRRTPTGRITRNLRTGIFGRRETGCRAGGSMRGGYDLVIATKCAGMRRATSAARCATSRRRCGPTGLLLLNENHEQEACSPTRTFALARRMVAVRKTPRLRLPGCPCLSLEAWYQVSGAGGIPVDSCCDGPWRANLGQYVIVGESDGVVRQLQTPTLGEMPGPLRWPKLDPIAPESESAGSEDIIRAKCRAYVRGMRFGKVLRTSPDRIDFTETADNLWHRFHFGPWR